MLKKDINHIFYRFSYPVDNTFDNESFEKWLWKVSRFRLNHDDPSNLECIWISYLSNFLGITYTTFDDSTRESLFFWRFVKWNYGDQIYLYSKTWDFTDIEEDTSFIWRESDKTPDEMVVKDFYYILKLEYDREDKKIKWIISKPTLKDCLSKNELEFIVRKIIEDNFSNLDTSLSIQIYRLEEILWQQELSNFSGKWLTISYVETKKVWDFMDDLGQEIDWYDDSDTIDVNVVLNKTNASKIKNLIQRFIPAEVSQNLPIKNLVIRNDFWKIINMEEFCFNCKVEWVEINDWTVASNAREWYLSKLSKFLVEKVLPNI